MESALLSWIGCTRIFSTFIQLVLVHGCWKYCHYLVDRVELVGILTEYAFWNVFTESAGCALFVTFHRICWIVYICHIWWIPSCFLELIAPRITESAKNKGSWPTARNVHICGEKWEKCWICWFVDQLHTTEEFPENGSLTCVRDKSKDLTHMITVHSPTIQ